MTEALEPSKEEIEKCVHIHMHTHARIISSCRQENRKAFLNKYCATPWPKSGKVNAVQC